MRSWLHLSNWSLRAKLAALLVVVSVLPLVISAYIDIRDTRQRLTEHTADILAARGDQLVGEIDTFHRAYQLSARRFAHLPAIVALCGEDAKVAEEAKQRVLAVLKVQPTLDSGVRGAGVLDPKGVVLAATERVLVGKSLTGYEHIRTALTGAEVVSDVFVAGADVGRQPSIAYLTPVRGADKRVIGFVALWVKAKSLWEIIRESNALGGPNSFAVIFNHDGIRIAHTYSDDIVFYPGGAVAPEVIASAAAENRYGERTRELLADVKAFPEQYERSRVADPDGKMFRGFAPVNRTMNFGVARRLATVSWTVFYMVPESALDIELARMTRQKSWFALVIVLAALVVGLLFTRSIVRPIHSLSVATEALAKGALDTRVETTREDELGRLGSSFNQMAKKLQQQAKRLTRSNEELEEKVVERTAELRESEESLATTLDSIGDGVIATDEQARVRRMNPVAERLTGWKLDDARGRPLAEVFQIVDESTKEQRESPAERVLREGVVVDLAKHTVLLGRDGTERPIADSGAPIRDASGNLRGIVLVFRDQTEERRTEALLQASHARRHAILEAALDAIVTIDAAGTILEFNPAAERTFGYSRADAVGEKMAELLVPPSLRQQHLAGIQGYLVTEQEHILGKRLELRALHADGSEFPAELTVVRIPLEGPAVFSAFIRDISERRRAAEALEVSEARFRHLSESGIIGIMICDTLGCIHEANDALLKIVGFSREELETGSLRWPDITPPEFAETDRLAVRELIETGVSRPREKEYVRKDGTRAAVLVGAVMLEAPKCIAFVLDRTAQKHAEDIGERAIAQARRELVDRERVETTLRETEQQLRQAQKMEAIGTLAGSVAHDFNNLLSVILSYAQLLRDQLQPADPMRADLEQIGLAGKRGADLTRQLLAFSRQQVLQPRLIGLNEVVTALMPMLRRLVGEHIELSFNAKAKKSTVFVDKGQMEQVVLNLVVNARDAMEQGGRIAIETADVVLDETYAADHLGVTPGPHVVLSVSDTGSGMDAATQERIFEPFFTTKPKDKGTGLGLSTVFGIVKQSSGSVWVYSEVGTGTTFKVFLPLDTESTKPAEVVAGPEASLRGTETILLVEDETQVRVLACVILRRNGYRVLDAANGGDALLITEQFKERIDLLVTDVVMPRMSGRLLWERLKPLRPELRVLFMSGYTDDAILHHGVLSSELAFIQKPLMPQPLLAKVREVLDAREHLPR